MDTASDTGSVRVAAGPGRRPASVASARLSRAALTLGALGVVSSLFVIARVAEAWRITGAAATHQISIFGHTLTYPSANVDAIVVLALALIGLVVTAMVLTGVVRELARAARVGRQLAKHASCGPYGTLMLEDERPRAFCAGLLRPRVFLTTAAVAELDEDALKAVLAHEGYHVKRHDPLRFAAEHVLSSSLFFVPGVRELVRRHRRMAELSADESAVNAAPANRIALARAMLRFSDHGDATTGIDAARVDHLLGELPSWRFPILLSLAGGALLALVVAISLLAGRVATGSATLSLPVLSRQPCVVVLATIPITLGALAISFTRRARR
jgi:Zn-dependent protease with chaperone function